MSVVQIFNNEEEEYRKFQEINKEHRRAHIRSVLYYSIYFPVAEIIGASSIGLLVWLALLYRKKNKVVRAEKQKSDSLLKNILPDKIINNLLINHTRTWVKIIQFTINRRIWKAIDPILFKI